MKGLSVEEKAKAYDEALERAKIWQEHLYDVNDKDYADELNYIFPELKESEDERIRKFLIDFIKVCGWSEKQFPHREDCVAWLEKQGEQKPTLSEEDEGILDEIIDFLENGTVKLQHDLSLYASWLKSLKYRYTWKPSDAQMIALNDVITNGHLTNANEKILKDLQEQLKKLRGEKQ